MVVSMQSIKDFFSIHAAVPFDWFGLGMVILAVLFWVAVILIGGVVFILAVDAVRIILYRQLGHKKRPPRK